MDSQMWKLHGKLKFPSILRLAAIYTWAPAFNIATYPYFIVGATIFNNPLYQKNMYQKIAYSFIKE